MDGEMKIRRLIFGLMEYLISSTPHVIYIQKKKF